MISLSSGSINTLAFSFYARKKTENKDIYVSQKSMISPVLIGGFVEIDRALLYMPRIGLKVKQRFLSIKRTSLKLKVNQGVAVQNPPKMSVRPFFLWDTL